MRFILTWCVLSAVVAAAQTPDKDVEKAFEAVMRKAAAPKDADDARKKAVGDEFRAALKEFTATWGPRAAELGAGRRALARGFLLAGDPASAVPHLEDFVRRQSASPDLEEALMELGAAYLDVGEADRARDLYKKFLDERPKSDLALAARYYYGVALLDGGATDAGLAALETTAASEQDHPLVADARLKIVRVLGEVGRVDEAKTRLDALLKAAPDAEALRVLKEELDRIGTEPPEIKGVRTWLQGAPTSLAAERGKVVVLCFFADFYDACRAELDLLADLSKAFADKPVVFVGLTTYYRKTKLTQDAEDAQLRAFLVERKTPFRVGVVEDFSLLKAYGVRGVPTTVVVGKDGKVAHLKSGGSRTERRGAAALRAATERAVAKP